MDARPNFLVVMTDQQRGDCLGIEGHPALLTPNMDCLAAEGVRFTRCYTTVPSCIAARRSLLSGQFPETHGMVGYRDNIEWDAPPTLPGVLSRAGYHTCLVGRDMHQYPTRKRHGFDHMVTHSLVTSDYDEWLSRAAPEGAGGYYGAGLLLNDWTARSWHMEESLHMTHWTVNEALRFLRLRDPSQPFFLAVSFLAPHPPLTPPAFYMERYLRMDLPAPVIGDWAVPPPDEGRGAAVAAQNVNLTGEALRSCRAGYYGLINHIDDEIRRLFQRRGGATAGDNTVIILTSDHGEMLGDHYLWRKSVPYEAAARIPLLVRAPERLGLRRRLACDRPVCLEDVMPTILEMAGAEVPPTVQGKSLLPLLRGESPPWRAHLHIEHAPKFQCLTDGREKYIWFVEDGSEQFFDLARDPQECHDLARDPAAAGRVAAWRSRLIAELRNRPEGFSDGERLIPGRPYPPVMAHGGRAIPPA